MQLFYLGVGHGISKRCALPYEKAMHMVKKCTSHCNTAQGAVMHVVQKSSQRMTNTKYFTLRWQKGQSK